MIFPNQLMLFVYMYVCMYPKEVNGEEYKKNSNLVLYLQFVVLSYTFSTTNTFDIEDP